MNSVKYVCPYTGEDLLFDGKKFSTKSGNVFFMKNNIPRFCSPNNYTKSFGFQWNKFDRTQLDSFSNCDLSYRRFWASTNWNIDELKGKNILEVGCGAGRFTEVFLKSTEETLYSLDYSSAVEANMRNNYSNHSRLNLVQASIYEMPFKDGTFDKIFCFGVLQHTPSFEKSVLALIKKLKKHGEIVVDFYPSKGLITRIHSKYLLRPITKRIPKKILLFLISKTINISLFLVDLFLLLKIDFLVRFIPITDIRGFPNNLNKLERKRWAIMDTFDAFSPEFDNPQKLENVVKMFEKGGCKITFGGVVNYNGGATTVIRAVKK